MSAQCLWRWTAFLTQCNFLQTERIELFKILETSCPNFINLSAKDKVVYMLSSEGKLVIEIGKFCYINFEKRKQSQLQVMQQGPGQN